MLMYGAKNSEKEKIMKVYISIRRYLTMCGKNYVFWTLLIAAVIVYSISEANNNCGCGCNNGCDNNCGCC